MKSNTVVTGIAALALVLAGVAIYNSFNPSFGGLVENQKKSFFAGLFAGDNRQFELDRDGNLDTTSETVVDGFTQGGGVVTLTDANGGTYTLTEDELLSGNYLKFAAGGAGQAVVALTFPATSTLDRLIPTAGDCREYIYDASALAAATTTTITAGTGIDVIAYTTNDDVIDGNEFAEIRLCRQADSDVSLFTTEMLQAD